MNNQWTKRYLTLSASVAALCLGGNAAWAQEAPAPAKAPQAQSSEKDGVEDIIVTAQFRSENLQDTPLSITATSGAMMDARNQSNVIDVARLAPNVTLTPAGAGFGSSSLAFIRGVGQSDFIFALEPGVGMYLDDVYYGVVFGSIFDVSDLDRIEVLRGPQGTLAGKNSIGGAIKLFSKKPERDPSGYVEATYGSYDRLDLRAGANFALVPDRLFARVSGVSKHRNGYVTRLDYSCANPGSGATSIRFGDGCKLGTEGGQKLWALRGALRWLPADGIENNLIVDASHDDSEVQPSKLISQGPWAGTNNFITPERSYSNYATFTGDPGTATAYSVPPVSTARGYGVSNTLDVDIGDSLALKSITAYRKSSGLFSKDTDLSPADVILLNDRVSHRQFSQELRLSGKIGSLVDWTIGGFYYHARSTDGSRININFGFQPGGGGIPGVLDPVKFLGEDSARSTSKSGFAHAVLHATPDLNLTAGIRYTDEEKTYSFSRRATDGGPHPTLSALDGLTGKFSGSRVDYRLAADYKLSDDFMLFAQFSTGFKGGGVNPRPFFPFQVVDFAPETLTAYEAGFKWDFLDRKARLNVSTFYNRYKNIQLNLFNCDYLTPPGFPANLPCAVPANTGNARIIGLEIEGQLRPVDGFIIDGAFSYLDFDYTQVETSRTGVTADMVTPYTPKWKYSIGVQYEIDVASSGSITPRVDYSYQSAVFSNAVNVPESRVAPYGLLNARLTWRAPDKDLEVSLSATNLLNKFYFNNKSAQPGAPYFAVSGQPGRPREWAITVKKSF